MSRTSKDVRLICFANRLVLQFDIPVGVADKLGPTADAMFWHTEEMCPTWSDRLLHQFHIRFNRRATTLTGIALNTGQNAVFPAGTAVLRSRHNVIDRQINTLRLAATILTLVLIASEQVTTTECDRLLRNFGIVHQHDDLRDQNRLLNRLHDRIVFAWADARPVLPVVSLIVVRIDRLDGAISQHDQAACSGCDTDRLPGFIKDQRRPVESNLRHISSCVRG